MEFVNVNETKAWSSIEIFLFSNGQQYSPPRKYHITSEELQWWEATLSYLGHTQYGSGQSLIELYTIDGKKVNGPLELSNGAAYVAVKPPDSFINAGYEDYLLKASRSRDKRLAQKANDDETTKLENKELKTEDFADAILGKKNVADEICPLKVADDIVLSTPLKTQPNKSQRVSQQKSITKQVQKKKSSDANNTTSKRISPKPDKIFSSPRKSSLKKSDDANVRRPSISCSNPLKRNVCQPQSVRSKRPSFEGWVKRQDNNKNNSQPIKESNDAKHLLCPLISCDEELKLENKIGSDQNSQVNKTLSGKEQQVISLYKNKDIDLTSLITDADYDDMIDQKDDALKTNTLIQNEYILEPKDVSKHLENVNEFQHIHKIYGCDKKESSPITLNYEEEKTKSSNISVVDTQCKKMFKNEFHKSNNQANVANNEVTDEYIAFMNKGALLLLKFHIKVKDCKTICNRNKCALEQTTSLNNLHKTEKTSQVNIDINFSGELLSENKVDRSEKKSLELLLNTFYTENKYKIQNENPRLIILQCACRKRLNDQSVCCHEKEDKSKSKLNENHNKVMTWCQCNIMSEKTSISAEKIDIISFPQSNGTRVKTLAQKFEGSDKIVSKDTNTYDLLNNKNISDNENNSHALVLTRFNDASALQAYDDIQGKDKNNTTALKLRFDKATQTDWSNVILEARRQEDDTYKFHLPSLYVLKQCML